MKSIKVPFNWKLEEEDKYSSIVICPQGHKFSVDNKDKITGCATCSVSGFYKQLIELAELMTGVQWIADKGVHRIKRIYNMDTNCKIGALYGKRYDKRIKLDIIITNKFPKIENNTQLLERELKSKLQTFLSEQKTDIAERLLIKVNSYEPSNDEDYNEYLEMCKDALITWQKKNISINDLKEVNKWLDDAIDTSCNAD